MTTSERTVEGWNAAYPVGTPVLFWPGSKDEPARRSRTRTPAWSLSNGIPLVSVEDYAGGIALTHVEPTQAVPDPRSTASDEATNIDLRARELAETVVKAATSLKEWRDGGFARQAQRIGAVQALLEPRMRAADVSPAPPAALPE